MAGPVVGAATSPQISWRSFSSTPVETYSIRQTRAPVGNPGLVVLVDVRSTASTRSPGPRPAGTGPPTPLGPAHGVVSGAAAEVGVPPSEDPVAVGEPSAPLPPDEHDETTSMLITVTASSETRPRRRPPHRGPGERELDDGAVKAGSPEAR